jgi:hypothetical protein
MEQQSNSSFNIPPLPLPLPLPPSIITTKFTTADR